MPRLRVHAAHDQHRLDARRPCPRHRLRAVGVELRHVDVAVGVHQSQPRMIGQFWS
jgi:hypothetical protein